MKPAWLITFALAIAVAVLGLLALGSSGRTTPYRVALVQLTPVDDATIAGFKEAMTKLGYRDGHEIVYLSEGAVDGIAQLDASVSRLLREKPDLVFVASTPATQVVKQLTEAQQTPPVVFAPVNNPLAAGIVSDLRHPGGHITGIRLPAGDDLRLQWLQRIVPNIRRVYLPYTADDKSALASLEQANEAAGKLGIALIAQPLAGSSSIDSIVSACPETADAIFIPRDSRIEAGVEAFVELARRRHLPIAAPSLAQTQAGALFSYGFVHRDIGIQAAQLADRILKGAKAGDLPIEMAENHLAINLASAKDLGITISNDLITQADYLIRP
jgi:putative ABC transport system substrate-binding protein